MERDEFYIGERVEFDASVLLAGGSPPPNLSGSTPSLVVAPPPDEAGAARAEEMPTILVTGTQLHAEYGAEFAGWHEWRLQVSGVIAAVQQGRFKVIPLNV